MNPRSKGLQTEKKKRETRTISTCRFLEYSWSGNFVFKGLWELLILGDGFGVQSGGCRYVSRNDVFCFDYWNCDRGRSDGAFYQENRLIWTMTIFRRPKERIPEQKELAHFDEKHDRETDDEIFSRKERLSNLEEGKFATDRNTIFSAILQELKEKAKKKT